MGERGALEAEVARQKAKDMKCPHQRPSLHGLFENSCDLALLPPLGHRTLLRTEDSELLPAVGANLRRGATQTSSQLHDLSQLPWHMNRAAHWARSCWCEVETPDAQPTAACATRHT